MKKKLIIAIIIIVAILLIPIPLHYKDGGSVEYKAIVYSVTDIHRIDFDSDDGYQDGTIIKILGFEIYNNVE
ncbi:MAG: hypothetical protein IKL53_07695 [Lachnospiraceae bacterium]|nr:hypothetical protein [Lachnospiraceae bacterium]